MSDAPEPALKKKKGGLVKKLIFFVVLPLVLIGGGAGAGLYAAGRGMVGHADGKPKEDPNRPKLMLKGEGEHGEPAEGPEPANPDPAMYQATYYPLEQPFTSNVADTDGFLQVGIGVSTFYDSRVIDNLKHSDMPVRSAILGVLSNQSASSVSTPEGKDKLRKQLRDAINGVLKEQQGFGGISGVYFTTFIVQ